MLVKHSSTMHYARREAGGKAYNLYLMSREGLPVPDWVAIGKSAYAEFLAHNQLKASLAPILSGFQQGEQSAAIAAQRIAALMREAPLPESIVQQVNAAFASFPPGTQISVRSSASGEDGAAHSFAGQLSSFLYVREAADVLHCLRECWISAFSERALSYRQEQGIDLAGISVAVIFQRMIDPDVSGVLFTCDPTSSSLSQWVISSVYGVGEGLVSGALDADTFWLAADTGSLLREELVEKREALRAGATGGCIKTAVDQAQWHQASLTQNQLQSLYELGKKLASFYGQPQDIEWALQGDRIYLLQARPVTSLGKNLTGFPNLWDNSNIVESYGGVTSPLSFTFALRNYKNVYVQFCEILGLPRHVVKDMEPYLGNMLGCVKGRVYYNLYNWYKLVGVLPGFKNNRQFMETMMGVGEELSPELEARLRPHPSWDSWRGTLRKLRTGLTFIYYHYAIQSVVDRFLTDFHRDYDSFRRCDYERMTSDQIFEKYLDMDRVMLSKWQAPIINDFLCMVHFGVLKKLTSKWLARLGDGIQNDLLAGEGQLESAEPTKTLIRMAAAVVTNPDLKQLVDSTPAENLLEALQQSPHQEFYAKVQDYIDRFGFRCMSEMKLEEKDLTADPAFLFVCLKNYLRSGTTDLGAYERREKLLRQRAEEAVAKELKGFKKIIYSWSLRHARKAVRNRENTRFARTRAYGVGRTMFRAMGHDLCARGVLARPEDIFFLTLDEIFGIHQGTLPVYNLQAFVTVRQKEYARYETQEPKARFLSRGPVYWQNDFLAGVDTPEVEDGAPYHLKGLACCPGIVEGRVKLVKSPTDDLNLNGEILVASRTDPGWVPLYPSISGLLVERGSLLSHSAIVAREMGLPTIVSIKGLTATLKTGMLVRIDGTHGTVTILSESVEPDDQASPSLHEEAGT